MSMPTEDMAPDEPFDDPIDEATQLGSWPPAVTLGTVPTPGPWTFSPARGMEGHGVMAQVWGPGGRSLAIINNIDAHATPNARLIAAAPEMSKALRLIDAFYTRHFKAGPDSLSYPGDLKVNWSLIRTLLARIDGEPEGGETP